MALTTTDPRLGDEPSAPAGPPASDRSGVDACATDHDLHEPPATTDAPAASAERPSMLRWAVIGTLIGTVVVSAVYGSVAFVAGAELVPAIGVGLFTAAWGGPGMGGMAGAVLHATRYEDG